MFYEHLKKIEIQIVCVDGWGGCINKWVDGKAVAEMAGGIRYLKIKITEEDIKSFSDCQEIANMKKKTSYEVFPTDRTVCDVLPYSVTARKVSNQFDFNDFCMTFMRH